MHFSPTSSLEVFSHCTSLALGVCSEPHSAVLWPSQDDQFHWQPILLLIGGDGLLLLALSQSEGKVYLALPT